MSREHAGNAAMLEALGITHVVSVGETLISCPRDCDPMYGKIGPNALVNAHQDGRIKVYVLLEARYVDKADMSVWTSRISGTTGMIHFGQQSPMLAIGLKRPD